MYFTVKYGCGQVKYEDVTNLALMKCYRDGRLYIPGTDFERSWLFGDPCPNHLKELEITFNDGNGEKMMTYPIKIGGFLNLDRKSIKHKAWLYQTYDSSEEKLMDIQKLLWLLGGDFKEEYPEQLLSVEFIPSNAKVLELGSNIGRNTLIIASLLENEHNLVTLECNAETVKILSCNKYNNEMDFQIEPSALSARKLYVSGWVSYTEESKPVNATEVKTISWPDFQSKYKIEFDTLVADCEGALYHILQDAPEMLESIKLIIVENDYTNPEHKLEVDKIFTNNGFQVVKSVAGGWGQFKENFYEVWKR